MPASHKQVVVPNFKRDVVALFKAAGPCWMIAALVIVTLPVTLLCAGYMLRGLAELLMVLR